MPTGVYERVIRPKPVRDSFTCKLCSNIKPMHEKKGSYAHCLTCHLSYKSKVSKKHGETFTCKKCNLVKPIETKKGSYMHCAECHKQYTIRMVKKHYSKMLSV